MVRATYAMPPKITPRRTFQAHRGPVRQTLVTPDGRRLVTRGLVGEAGEVRVWEIARGRERTRTPLRADAIALSPDGLTLALAQGDAVRLWDLRADRSIRTLIGHDAPPRALAFAPDGKTLAAAWPHAKFPSRTSVTLWETGSGRSRQTLAGGPGAPTALAFLPDGKALAVATQDFPMVGQVELREIDGGTLRAAVPAFGVDALALSSDGRTLAAGCIGDGIRRSTTPPHHVRLWDVAAAENRRFLGCEGRVYTVALSPDGTMVAGGTEYAELNVWDTDSGAAIATLPKQSHYVLATAFTPDGKTLISATRDGYVSCWPVR